MRASSRRWRGRFAWVALVCFAFAQVAVAAYICADTGAYLQSQRMEIDHRDCHRVGGQLENGTDARLCKAYCQRDAQVKPSALSDLPDPAAGAAPALFARAPLPVRQNCPDAVLSPHGDPPLYLRNCVLRN